MGRLRNIQAMLGTIVTRKVDGALWDWIESVSQVLDGPIDGLTQTAWFIDPVNGSDTNLGNTAAQALKTDGERQRRWGFGVLLTQPTTITYLNAPPATDVVNFACRVGLNVTLSIQGTRTTVKSGTFQAVTPSNRATQTPWSITDAVGAPGAADVGRFMRITSGPRAGTYMRIVKDLGGNSVRISTPVTFAPGTVPVTKQAPQIGDAYEIVTLPQIPFGSIAFTQEANQPVTTSFVQFDSMIVDGASRGVLDANASVLFALCVVQNWLDLHSHAGVWYAGSGVEASVISGRLNRFIATSTLGLSQSCAILAGGINQIDLDAYLSGLGLVVNGGWLQAGTVAIFDGNGAALEIRGGGYMQTVPLSDGTDLLWGTGSTRGLEVTGGGRVCYTTLPTVNAGLGPGREVLVGATDKTWATVPFADTGPAGSQSYVVVFTI